MNSKLIRNSMISARDEYIKAIKEELMGPGSEFSYPKSEHELISSSPLSRYTLGILFPQGDLIEQDNDEVLPIGEEEEAIITDFQEEPQPPYEKNNHKTPSQFDETANENLDEEIGMANQFKPSSMGMTFQVKGETEKLYCNVSFATYRKAGISDCVVPFEPENPESYKVPPELAHIMIFDREQKILKLFGQVDYQSIRKAFESDTIPENEAAILKKSAYRLIDFLRVGYVRVPHTIENIEIDFKNSDYCKKDLTPLLEHTKVNIVGVRTQIEEGYWAVTLMLVNSMVSHPAKAIECIFQSKIEVLSKLNTFDFSENNITADPSYLDEEEKSLELLYRHKKIYGIGLGTAVDWMIDQSGKGSIWTEFLPEREIPSMNFSLPNNIDISDDELSMKYLSDLSNVSKEDRISSLIKLVDLYVEWINSLKEESKIISARYKSAALKNIDECVKASERMYSGIRTLESNEKAYTAFLLANRAMFMQRVHIQKQVEMSRSKSDRYPDDLEITDWLTHLDYKEEDDSDCKWRPFQIAFILMDIKSIVFDNDSERSLVDLIWFPTGGGKTEAYLGLTAFTIFYRKLEYPDSSGGTAVIMRYTLRLLAAQQFTRASTLICACEFIREDSQMRKPLYPSYPLGKSPITIGLWIGGSHIPNNNTGNNSAEFHLERLANVSVNSVKTEKERHNKFQVLKCPWCGTKMVKDSKDHKLVGAWGYAMRQKHFFMFCPHEDCHFTKQLPIQIIDEELYNQPPTLLFGTVDKFAMMAWDGRIGSFFAMNSENRSPELIIQDELHLISGALGTMVGLYETAVDGLSGMKGVKPKVIASTATIRRAKEQCSVLYNRKVVQFPPPGLNAEDSFFAKEEIIDYEKGKFGRKYIGIMPSGRTKAMTEIRSMAALLQKIHTMNIADEIKDKFWTLTVYFNSLKDLGKASTLVEDDIKDFIIRSANRMFTTRRSVFGTDELTSRVSTTELNETLEKLERIEYSKDNKDRHIYASNVLLATNMISVGIDVARLNVMLMVGQPKLTSEYIQASSRVGRSYPGVVFVQYDATKSRDRSHYEQFRSYHDSFYRFVEPTAATPFSKPARDRALHAVFTALLRQKCSLSDDTDANSFDVNINAAEINDIIGYIVNRVQEINDRAEIGLRNDPDDVRAELEDFVYFWQECVEMSNEENKPLRFGRRYMVTPPIEGELRLLKQFNTSAKDDAKETLTSMRNVDTSVTGSVIIWED